MRIQSPLRQLPMATPAMPLFPTPPVSVWAFQGATLTTHPSPALGGIVLNNCLGSSQGSGAAVAMPGASIVMAPSTTPTRRWHPTATTERGEDLHGDDRQPADGDGDWRAAWGDAA